MTEAPEGGAIPTRFHRLHGPWNFDLEKVAGGKQDIHASRTVIGLAAAGNTVTQINL